MDASFLPNLWAYSAQIAFIVAIGSLGAAALRVDAAPVRYAYWRLLLALCLVLPWMQGRENVADAAAAAAVTATFEAAAAGAEDAAAAGATVTWMPLLAAIVGGGMVLRLMWLGAGLLRLRRLRSAGLPAASNGDHDELQRALGTCAGIRYVPGLRQPVTFGARRPVVLLPDRLRDCGPHIQRAVLCHELFHVQRRDWMWALAEEGVRAVFWFHPGMWWVISRVQLAREEAVDELVVLATGHRRTYLEALLAFADEAPLAPAAAFARRRHLYRRMMLISKEAVMTSRRVVITCAVMALVVSAGSWYAVRAFPLMQGAAQDLENGPGPLERRAKPITPENPIPRRTYSVMPVYPPEAGAIGLTVIAPVLATLDEYGRVAEARVFNMGVARAGVESDPAGRRALDAVRRSAVDAVRQWQYDAPADGPISFTVTLAFAPGAAMATEARGADGSRVALAVRESLGGRGGRAGAPPRPTPDWAAGAVRVGGLISQPTKVKHVPPVYPQYAQDARVQGVVIIEALIAPDGRVGEARVIRSIPLLDQAAVDAVTQWEFTPTRLNGVPTPVIMTVTVNFTLAE
jgi:protein TonB